MKVDIMVVDNPIIAITVNDHLKPAISAIKPIKGCHKKYLKLLNEDSIYYLYREFTIDENSDRISFEKKIPEILPFHDFLRL